MAFARVADVAITYRFSPDLAFEGNPMVRLLGMGWPFLLTANLLAVFAIGACSLSWLQNPLQYEYSPDVRDAWSFASFASFNRVYSRPMFLWKRLVCTPKNWRHSIQLLGFVAPVTVVGLSVAAVFSWYAMYSLHWGAYEAFYKTLWPVFPYGVVIPLIWISAATFYRSEHARYRATPRPLTNPVAMENAVEQPELLTTAVAVS
ncbi:MAG: hypothetical protein K8R87_05525 [Verrucomicrobia bacterium]|nr:hypothetical protein [Verrucomicrobiota bacterium]